MRKALAALVVLGMLLSVASYGQDTATDAPWWKTQKMRFMWGQWAHARTDKSENFWGDADVYGEIDVFRNNGQPRSAGLPRELFRNIADAGATVFTEMRWYNPDNARHSEEFGLKYFATLFVYDLHKRAGERKAVTKTGVLSDWASPWCPLDEAAYENWMVEPHLEGARQGLIDGIHVDWERYGGAGEAEICYCDDCFSNFPAFKKTGEALPDAAKRAAWVTEHDLDSDYDANYSTRRTAMFTRIREKLQAVNPDLLFSSYGTVFSDFTRGANTPETPFIFLDARHYYNDDRQAWWESYGSRLREEGYLYIPGGWTNSLFGAQASQVSAARWIYEASINEDGCWLWFERELDDEILRAYSTADRRIQGVLGKVGRYLFHGERDSNFATAVEWTGRPELEKAVMHQTYNLDGKHLVHVNNVDTEWPVRVRLRFPRLPEGGPWMVRDVMNDLYYSRDETSVNWTRDDLAAGVVVTLEPRSDLFMLVAPAEPDFEVDRSRLIHSRDFDALPDHEAASKAAGPIKTMIKLYRMENAIYEKELKTLLSATKKVFDLPKAGWRFKMDKEDMGPGEKWYLPATPVDDWVEIETEAFWGSKGGTGAGWYRRDVDVPALPEGKRVYLHFGAVDEHLVLWIDGEYAGDYDREIGAGWDQPFAIDVTGKLTGGGHHLAMRVFNVIGAGGVWKPVSVRVGGVADAEKAPQADVAETARPSGLLYTATEPMGFEGAEGGLTIGNVIRTLDARGDQVRVRQFRGHLWSPRYSPDATRIAFVHDAGGRGQIYCMNADGSGAVNLSDNDYCDRMPRWSPDGAALAFMSDRTGDWDIYTMNADGSDQRRLAGNPGLDRAVDWSPDGTKIAWESHVSGRPNVWIVDADGQNSRPLIAPDQDVTITEGNVGQNAVFNFAEVAWPFADNIFIMTDPVWSPDPAGAGRIAAVLLSGYSSRTVVAVDLDGSRILNVTEGLPSASNLAWSPDSKHIAGTWRTAPQETERSGIFVVKADGTDTNRYGKWLVDVRPQGPRLGGAQRSGLMSWYSHGSAQPRRVVKTFTSLAWSPDGKTIAFSCDMDPSGAFYVYTINASGGEAHRLEQTRSAWPQEIRWRP